MLYQLSYSRLVVRTFSYTPYLAEDGVEPPIFGLWARWDTVSLPRIYVGKPGFEPGQTESKAGVLPLDDFPFTKFKLLKKGLEPSSRKAYAPQAYMYTSSITSAFLHVCNFFYKNNFLKINSFLSFFILSLIQRFFAFFIDNIYT